MRIKTIAEAQRRADKKASKDPRTWTLARLLAWVQEKDKLYKGKTEVEIFGAVYYDKDQALDEHARALKDRSNAGVRQWCLERYNKRHPKKKKRPT